MQGEDRYLELDGARIHYLEAGRGEPLLLLHGNPTWSFAYRHLIYWLSNRYRCIAPDYPGFGLSTAPAGYGFTPREHSRVIERFVEALDLRDLTLFVHDWGGPIGLGFAGRRPERVRRLVIGNTWAWPVNGDPHFERFSRFMGGAVGRFLILRFNFFVNRVMPRGILRRKRLPPEVMAMYRRPFPRPEARVPVAVLPREILGSRDYLAEVEQGLARLRDRPTLIVWATGDIAFRAQERERFEALFPRHRTVPLEGVGHYLQEDAPEDVVSAIEAWRAEEAPVAPPLREPAAGVGAAVEGGST
jgi:haloalkane dehalogenase